MKACRVISEVESRCRQRGLRLTPTRRRVLELVLSAQGPIKAYDLLDRLKLEQPGAAPPTVYRALDFLLEHHFIHRLESLNAFVSCFHPEEAHQGQFLICDECHSVHELHDADLERKLRQTMEQESFQPSRQILEIHGLCMDCAGADSR